LLFFTGFFGASLATAQTCDVTWRKAENPRMISNATTIPAGQTVCAEPGVVVQFGSQGEINLFGTLIAQGTAAEPVRFNGGTFPNRVRVVGTLDIRHADIGVAFEINPGGSLFVRDSRFRENGLIHTLTFLVGGNASKFILVENSVFDSNDPDGQAFEAGIYVLRTTLVLRNVTLRNGGNFSIGESNLFIDNITAQNLKYYAMELSQPLEQPQLLDTINVNGSPTACISFLTGNYKIGPNTVLQGCQYPVKGGGGLLPSNLPTTGNQNNWIDGYIIPKGIYAPQPIPYVMDGGRISQAEVYPGTTFKLKPDAKFDTISNGLARILGLPNAPITFEPFVAGQKWRGFSPDADGDRMEYNVLDGMTIGIIRGTLLGSSIFYGDQSVFRNNDIAVNEDGFGIWYLEGNLFTNNGVAVNSTDVGGQRLNGVTNPNLFENNTIAVLSQSGGSPDVRNNWWNSPTGPTTPQNPGGTGDRIEGNAQFQPFRTVRPDRSDHPPVVRLPKRPFQITAGIFEGVFEQGQRIILTWSAFDNAAIVKQKIQVQALTNKKENFVTVADNLPGNQRAYEFTVPNLAGKIFVRVTATDDKGQEGWDEWIIYTPSQPGALQITTPVAGQVFRTGTELQLNWQITEPFNDSQFAVYLLLDAHRQALSVANGGTNGTFSTIKFPFVSTDSARFVVFAPNSRRFYSEPFSIRPDPRYPDAPPTVSLISPNAGQQFPAGGIVPISWTASDDEAIQSFLILYSTDGGKTWLTLAENLPPTATNYNWRLPLGTGFSDVRVRVVAVDKRFQNSSDGANRVFQITPNQTAIRRAQFDFDGDGRADIGVFRQGNWYLQQSTAGFAAIQFGISSDKIVPADYDGDGRTDAAVYRDGTWYLLGSAQGFTAVQFGLASDIPQTGDFDGDGKADFAVFRPSVGTWYLMQSSAGFKAVQFGQNGDKPVAADFDGDGSTDVAVYRAGVWYVLQSRDGFKAIQFGIASDKAVAADYDGDGKADFGVFRDGAWYLQRSQSGFAAIQFGQSGDIPAPADYDGDGKADFAVFRSGTWYLQQSASGFAGVQFGLANDVPIPSANVR
ncbi:MAG TPA: FG-GAP-like repeat-containing protein, partial [Pyrinomonadaceae bacterium]